MNRKSAYINKKSKKGFTLIELLVVIALIGVLCVLLTGLIGTVSNSYIILREKSQAISLANDLLRGIRDELKKTDTVYLSYLDIDGGISDGTNGVDFGKGIQINKEGKEGFNSEAMQLELLVPDEKDLDFFDNLSGMIYQANTVTDNGSKRSLIEYDVFGGSSMIQSKYYYNYQITGVHFTILKNEFIDVSREELQNAGFTQINNILQVSFDIKKANGSKVLFSVKNYNLYLDNLIANLYKSDIENGNSLATGKVSWSDLGIYSDPLLPLDDTNPNYPKNLEDVNRNMTYAEQNLRPYDLLMFTPRSNT